MPDFRLAVPDPITGVQRRLAELKVINCCSSRYKVTEKQKGVDKRARLLPSEYRRKAKNIDRDLLQNPDGQVGPVEHQLSQYGDLLGLVVGAWGEGSEDLHSLVKVLDQST